MPSDVNLAVGHAPQQERMVADILTAMGSTTSSPSTSTRLSNAINNASDDSNIVTITVVSTQVNNNFICVYYMYDSSQYQYSFVLKKVVKGLLEVGRLRQYMLSDCRANALIFGLLHCLKLH